MAELSSFCLRVEVDSVILTGIGEVSVQRKSICSSLCFILLIQAFGELEGGLFNMSYLTVVTFYFVPQDTDSCAVHMPGGLYLLKTSCHIISLVSRLCEQRKLHNSTYSIFCCFINLER